MSQIEPPEEWVLQAVCVGTRMWYETIGAHHGRITPADEEMEREALTVCRRCPVIFQCRNWALTSPDPAYDHVAGGMTPAQRWAARR